MEIRITIPDNSGLAEACIDHAKAECLNRGNDRGISILCRKALRAYLSKYGGYTTAFLDCVDSRAFPGSRKAKEKEV